MILKMGRTGWGVCCCCSGARVGWGRGGGGGVDLDWINIKKNTKSKLWSPHARSCAAFMQIL